MKIKNCFMREEIEFPGLEEAKNYFYPDSETDKEKKDPDNYTGDNFPDFLKQWEEFKKDISQAETSKELVEAVNRYTDIFGNGTEWEVTQ